MLHVHPEYPSVENVSAELTIDPVALLAKFFKLCNMPEFLENPSVRNLLEALSGQQRGSMFFTLLSDNAIPKRLWQLTIGKDLYPNIYLEMPERWLISKEVYPGLVAEYRIRRGGLICV